MPASCGVQTTAERPPVIRAVGLETRTEFPWGELFWLAGRSAGVPAGLTFGLCTIKPGQRNPRHYHPNCEEALFVIRGRCEHGFGDGAVTLERGQMILVPCGVPHYAKALGDEPLELVVAFSSGERETVFLEPVD